MNMDYATLSTLVENFQFIDEDDDDTKPIGVIRNFTETGVQCREMLQLVDNLSGQVHTDKQKAQHQRQQEYWVSNLDHVAKNLTVMEVSVMQIALGKLNLNKPTKTSLLEVIEQGKVLGC